jgi:hypothetical protein
MSGESGSPQIHHTASDSDPGGWAGSKASDVAENGASDSIDENGTDLKGVSGGLFKSIMEKVQKGIALSEAEQYVLKSIVSKASSDDKDDKKDKKDKKDDKDLPPFMKKGKEEDDKDMDKSLGDHAASNEQVQKGLEMSPFLAGWANAQVAASASSEERIVSRVVKSLAEIDAGNAAFQAELAKSVTGICEVLTMQAQRLEQLESTPARGPRSHQTPQAIDKSFGAGGAPDTGGEEMSKALVLDTMIDMVQKGKLHAQEVVKFESTSELRPDLNQAILAHRTGR